MDFCVVIEFYINYVHQVSTLKKILKNITKFKLNDRNKRRKKVWISCNFSLFYKTHGS